MTLFYSSNMRLLQLLCLSLAAATRSGVTGTDLVQATATRWWQAEQEENFAAYPSTVQDKFDRDAAILRDSSSLPVVRVFQAFPESSPDKRVWPLFKSMTRRLYPLLGPQAIFYMVDGETFGCRERADENTESTAIDSEHCRQHCIRAGRYCVPQKSSELPPGRNGHDILKEINRRLCFVEHYHTKGSPSVSFYDYVETFDQHNCFSNDTVTKCSVDAMKEVGAHHSKLQHCLREDSVDEDIASGVMEKNLRHLGQKTFQEMPQIEIDGSPILKDNSDNNRKPFDSKTVFQAYCDAYHASDRLKDLVACNICLPCQDVRTCLWELKCDGKSLYEESDVIVTQPPGTENSNSSTANKDKSQSNTINNNDEGGRSGPNITFVIMACFVIALAACPAAFYLLRDIRNRKLMSEIDKTLTFANDSNHEGLPSETESNSYSDSDPITGASRSFDLVDLVLANGSVSDNFEDAKQFEIVKHPDDILEDESEWVENKRVTPNAHIC